MAEFKYAPMFQLGEDKTEYYKIPGSEQYVSTGEFEGHEMLKVAKEGLTVMANTAFRDVSFMLRPEHNEMVAKILHDPEASENDKYVALTFLRNAEVACKGKLPFCQDTGTASSTARRDSRYGQDIATKRLFLSECTRPTLRRTSVIRRTRLSQCTMR